MQTFSKKKPRDNCGNYVNLEFAFSSNFMVILIVRRGHCKTKRCASASMQMQFTTVYSLLFRFERVLFIPLFWKCKKKPKQVAIEIINLWIYLYIFPFILYSVDALDALVHCVYSKEKEKWFHHNIVFFRCCRTTTASLTIWLMVFFSFCFS